MKEELIKVTFIHTFQYGNHVGVISLTKEKSHTCAAAAAPAATQAPNYT